VAIKVKVLSKDKRFLAVKQNALDKGVYTLPLPG